MEDERYEELVEEDDIRRISGRGMMALPGFINTHTHTGMSMLRGFADDMDLMTWLEEKIWPAEGRMSDEDILWGSRLAIVEMLKNGITTFNDMYFAVERIAEAVKNSGIRAQLGYGLIEEKDGEEGLEHTEEFIDSYHNTAGGRITCNIAPHAPYTCSGDYLKKIVDLSEKYDVRIHTHIAETAAEVENFVDSRDLSPVKYLDDLGLFTRPVIAVHCVHLDDGDIEILADREVSVSHNPSSNTKLASGVAPVKDMKGYEINISLGTDSAASNNNLDLITEARWASYLHKVTNDDPTLLDISDLMAMITENGAEALGLEKVGRIEPGYCADLILIDKTSSPEFYPEYNSLSNLFYAVNSPRVEYLFVGGREIVSKGEIQTLDEREIYEEVTRRAERMNS